MNTRRVAPKESAECTTADDLMLLGHGNTVLYYLLYEPSAPDEFCDLSRDDFIVPTQKIIFDAIVDVHGAKRPVNSLSVTDRLRKKRQLKQVGGESWHSELPKLGGDRETVRETVKYALDMLRDAAKKRQAAKIGEQLSKREIDAAKGLEKLQSIVIPAPELPPIDDACDLVASDIEEPKEVIVGLCHQGSKLVLGGASKAMKTHVLIDMGVSVGTGADFLGCKTRQGRVFFINLEIPRAFIRKRIKAIHAAPKDYRAACFLLERGWPSEYSRVTVERVEQIGEAEENTVGVSVYLDTAGQGLKRLLDFPNSECDSPEVIEEKQRRLGLALKAQSEPAVTDNAPAPKVVNKALTGRIRPEWKGNRQK
jgi:DnaB helicase-like protein/AAA domain-containing protein